MGPAELSEKLWDNAERVAKYLLPRGHLEGKEWCAGICLFGEMLNRFFALYTDIHLFNHMILILQPGGERLEWQENHNRRIPG